MYPNLPNPNIKYLQIYTLVSIVLIYKNRKNKKL